MNITREGVFVDVAKELTCQDERWTQEFDSKHTMNDWVSFITRYVGKAVPMREPNDLHIKVFRDNMIKVAALAIAAVETLDTNCGISPRHYD